MSLRPRTAARIYEIRHRIAVGGMGEIYEGFARELDRRVAIKRVLKSDDVVDLKELFVREVAVAAMLEHPNVVEVLDAGASGSDLYLVMEFVEGPSLAEVMEAVRHRRQILPIELTCGIIAPVARGLAHAHGRALPDGTSLGIVHRDVAPENVLITRTGIPKVADFGLARLAGHEFTSPGTIRGRPRCLSPEQARGDPIDVRSDVFALGAMLFEMVSGEALYPNEPLATLLWKVAAGEYESIRRRLPNADPDLIAILETALAVDPAGRYRSARELERAVDAFRAARGLRVDSSAISRLLADLAVEILRIREAKREDIPGELEGMRLVLPAERGDTISGDLPSAPSPRVVADPTPDLPSGFPKVRELSREVTVEEYAYPPQASFAQSRGLRRSVEARSTELEPSGPFTPTHRTDPVIPRPVAAAAILEPTPLVPAQAMDAPTSSSDAGGAVFGEPLPLAAWTSEIPRPSAPAARADEPTLGGRSEVGWLVFLTVVMIGAIAAFAGVWTGG